MEQIHLQVNQIIHDHRNDADYRILWLSAGPEPYGFWIRADGKSNIPKRFSIDGLQDRLNSGEASFGMDVYSVKSTLKAPNEASRSRRDRIWGMIRGIVSREPDVYDAKKRAEMLREVEKETGTHPCNIYNHLGRYWRMGKVPDALLPDYGPCGKTRDVYKDASKRPGRKKQQGADGKKLTGADLRNFQDAVDKYYLNEKKLTLEETYRKLKKDHYTVRDESGEAVSPMDPDSVPSRQQFLYWYRKNKDVLLEAKKRDGERSYNLSNRGVTGRTETHLYGPGMAAQIDATIADIFLVRKSNRGDIIGRPTMYFLMDSYSRMVTGMHISLDPPSWNSAAAAIINSVESKPGYCRRYGVDIEEKDWPCMHLPQVLLADRGEAEGRVADVLANSLNITIENAPPYRGDLKGIIEKHFDIINLEMGKLPGNVKKDYGARCSHDYRLDAILDIGQFTAIIIKCVITYNNYHYMQSYRKTPQMRQLQVRPIPLELWNYGIRFQTGGLRTMPYEKVRFALLPQKEASVTRSGILLDGLYYSCDRAEEEHWYEVARTHSSWKVTAAYDPSDAALIYICPTAGGDPIECHLLDKDWMYAELSKEEAEAQVAGDNAERERYRRSEDFAKVKLDEFIEAEIEKAEKLSPKGQEKSKAQRIAGIGKNRAEEKNSLAAANTEHTLESRGYPKAGPKKEQPEPGGAVSPITAMLQETLDEVMQEDGGEEGNADEATES